MPNILIPDWRRVLREKLQTARTLPLEIEEVLYGENGALRDPDISTLWLPVAGRRLDRKHDYSQIFPRDIITSAFMMEDEKLLRDVLIFCAIHQGRRQNPKTAEEPGKIFHQLEGVPLRRHNTLYCACDTTLLFVIGAAHFVETADFSAEDTEKTWAYLVPRIIRAWSYIETHLDERGLFFEDPEACGARNFALRATYLRDGGLCGRPRRRLAYPVSFLLVQAQLIAALRSFISLTGHGVFPGEKRAFETLRRKACDVFRTTFTGSPEGFIVAVDQEGPLVVHNTDPGIALWYLEPEDIDDTYRNRCLHTLKQLETPWGWRSTWHPATPARPGGHKDHPAVWPADHAFISGGLAKHGLLDDVLFSVAMRPAYALAQSSFPFSEFLRIRRSRAYPAGCHVQLWTDAYWSWVEHKLNSKASE